MVWNRHCSTDQLPANCQLLIFIGHDLVINEAKAPLLSAAEMAATLPDEQWRYVSTLEDIPVYASRGGQWVHWLSEHNEFGLINFRALLMDLGRVMFELIASASQLLTWEQEHNFCCRCGCKTRIHPEENAMCCDACGYRQYPRINPCVIVLITQGDKVLLARNSNFKAGYFSCIAGFIEPGETAEQAVHREVEEEIGVQVDNIRYFSSQSWPFPHSLMLGYICDYAGGEIRVDGKEIVEARWGRLEDFPLRPGEFAISGQLMKAFEHSLQQ